MPSAHSVQVAFTDSYNTTTGVTTLQDATIYDVSGNHRRADFDYMLIEAVMPSNVTDRFATHDFLSGEPYTELTSPADTATPPMSKTLIYDGFGFINFTIYAVPKKITSPVGAQAEYGLDDSFVGDENTIYKVVAAAGVDVTVDTDFTDTSRYERLDDIKSVTSRYIHTEADVVLNLGLNYTTCLDNILECGKENVICEDTLNAEFLTAVHFLMIDYVFQEEIFEEQEDIQHTIWLANDMCVSCSSGSCVPDYDEVYANVGCENKIDINELQYSTGFFHYLIPSTADENWISTVEIYFPQFVGLTLYDISVSISGQQLLFLEPAADANAIEQLTESGHLILKDEYPLVSTGRQITVFYKIYLT